MALLTRQKKKLRLDPHGPPKPGKRPSRAEQVFLTRRVLLARGAIVAGFATLAGRLGFMQIVKHEAYAEKAQANVVRLTNLKPSRGLIYDRRGRLLADNRRTWEVRVVPADLPEDPIARRTVLDQLINALALPDALVLDPNDIPHGQEETVYSRLIGTMISLGMASEERIAGWYDYLELESPRQYLVLVEDDLTTNEAAVFRAVKAQLPGVYVMNVVDYKIGNNDDRRLAVPIKTGVPKDIALRLEANKLLLPGVQVIDNVLVRRYHGGQVMSHLLGYARRMTAELYLEHKDDRYENSGDSVYEEDDTIGQEGLEYSFERVVRGIKGKRWIEVDSHGVEQREVDRTDPVPGRGLRLTLDLELQQAISKILADAIDFANDDRTAKEIVHAKKAQSGAVVAIDPRDGSVLAMVSYPHYDNQLFVDGISERQYDLYEDNKFGAALFNRAIAAEHPSGSTIKPFMAISALRDGKITPEDRFTCTGSIFIPLYWDLNDGNWHPCWLREGGHQSLNIYEALERSCDVFFYNVGAPQQQIPIAGTEETLYYYDGNYISRDRYEKHYFRGLGIELIHRDLTDRFWFGQATGIDLPGEKAGVVPNELWKRANFEEQGWALGDTINVSIGQGFFLATPLQMALNTAAIANRGQLWRPRLVDAFLDQDGSEIERPAPELLREVKIRPEQFDVVREGMRRVIHSRDGSAHHSTDRVTYAEFTKWPNTNPEGEIEIMLAGKTGTAELGDADSEGHYTRQHAWFTCFAPFDAPEIALAVVVEDGGEGSSYAVPVADKVLRAYFEQTGRRERVLLPNLLGEASTPGDSPAGPDGETETGPAGVGGPSDGTDPGLTNPEPGEVVDPVQD